MKNLIFSFTLLIVSLTSYSQKKIGDDCGTWRWDVKTATDAEGQSIISMAPVNTTIDELTSKNRPEKVRKDDPRFPEEKGLVKVTGFIIEHKIVGGKGDTDYHIVVRSPSKKSQLIVEIPNPECGVFNDEPDLKELFNGTRESYDEQIGTPPSKLKELDDPIEVEITGIPLWDMPDHGGGCSENGIEIHPVISIKKIGKKKSRAAISVASNYNSNNNNDNNNTENNKPGPTDLLAIIFLGAFLGMIGQGLRVWIGISKANADPENKNKKMVDYIETRRLVMSFLYAFIIGGLTGSLMAIDGISKDWDRAFMLSIITAGYAGTDFIEGFIHKNLK